MRNVFFKISYLFAFQALFLVWEALGNTLEKRESFLGIYCVIIVSRDVLKKRTLFCKERYQGNYFYPLAS